MFAEKLKELRKNYNLTQQELGEILCVSRSAVAKWEQGKGVPSKQTIKDICETFKISKKDLFNEDDVENVIGNLDIEKKRNKIQLIIGITILIILFLIRFIPVTINMSKPFAKNEFFSHSILNEYKLNDLKPIEYEEAVVENGMIFRANISGGEKQYNEYVSYVYDYLKSSPYISRVSFLTNMPSRENLDLINHYLVNSNSVYDHNDVSIKNYYEFYYFTEFPDYHKKQSLIKCKCLTIDFEDKNPKTYEYKDGTTIVENFYMSVRDVSRQKDILGRKFYLIEDFYNCHADALTKNNYSDYFNITIKDDKYLDIHIETKFYAFSVTANMEVTATIQNQNGEIKKASDYVDFYVFWSMQFRWAHFSHEEFGLDSLDGWELVDLSIDFIDDAYIYYVS